MTEPDPKKKHISFEELAEVLEGMPTGEKKIQLHPDFHMLDHHFWEFHYCASFQDGNWVRAIERHWFGWRNFKMEVDLAGLFKLIYCTRNKHKWINVMRKSDGGWDAFQSCRFCAKKRPLPPGVKPPYTKFNFKV